MENRHAFAFGANDVFSFLFPALVYSDLILVGTHDADEWNMI